MAVIDRQLLRTSWREWLVNDLRPTSGPAWLPWMWTVLFCAGLALGFTLMAVLGLARGGRAWADPSVWAFWYGRNFVVCLTIGVITHLLFDAAGWLLRGRPGPLQWPRGPRTLFYLGLPLLGLVLGWPLGLTLAGGDLGRWFANAQNRGTLAVSALIALAVVLAMQVFFGTKARQIVAERRATEAQLKLLQGQIEPHFLFNTLASVISTIDEDPARAKRVLQSFTDYLRASLGGLRRELVPLVDEVALAELYLTLMQARMDDRLRWRVDIDPQALSTRVPPLLLQPLVENAVRHGLEPSIAGGTVVVEARRSGDALQLQVQDDGPGTASLAGRASPGHGMALDNLRERLQAHYGARASLTLTPTHPGTRVTVTLPAG